MRRSKKILAAAIVAPAMLMWPACSSDKAAKEPAVVGKPPITGEKLVPKDSSADDPSSVRKAKTERLAPKEGEEDTPEDGDPEPGSPPSSKPSSSVERPGDGRVAGAMRDDKTFEGEVHLSNLRMLTRGGQNAEAYFNPAETHLVFQSTRGDLECDQIFTMKLDGSELTPISTGKGATTCAYFLPGGDKILYASTHEADPACPPKLDFRKFGGYVWPIHDSFDIFLTDTKGSAPTKLTNSPGYDAEATISPQGDRIVFTSTRDGDLDLYTMKIDGTDVRRLTKTLGYDGGAFFSQDGKKIVYRAHHYKDDDGEEAKEYKRLLAEGVVKPSVMELYVMNADGTGVQQVTQYGAASFGPFFHPSGEWIVFASNLHDPKGRDFDLYKVRIDGSGLERITFNPTFDGFPMFTADGEKLVFASNRANKARGETNVFIADWKD